MKTSPRRRHGNFTPFQPPCCPNQDCRFHLQSSSGDFRTAGTYTRPSDGRQFPRFRCRNCGRRFSTRAFSPTYWLRKRHQFSTIANLSVNGAGLRQTARILEISHATVGRHLARAGRHCLLFHLQLLHSTRITEPVVIDGFETFEYSQFYPFHLNLGVGAQSWFSYGFTESPLRRKGRMTKGQKLRRSHLEHDLGRPDPKAVEDGIFQLVSYVASKCAEKEGPGAQAASSSGEGTSHLTVRSDEHPAYPRALRRLQRILPSVQIRHERTSSMEARTFENPLFPVNLADLLIRHSHAGHRRETIAFSKRRQGAIERLAIFTVWRNAIKRRRENGDVETAAMHIGVTNRALKWKDVFRRRLFPARFRLPPPWADYYWRRIKTRPLGENQCEHRLQFAA